MSRPAVGMGYNLDDRGGTPRVIESCRTRRRVDGGLKVVFLSVSKIFLLVLRKNACSFPVDAA